MRLVLGSLLLASCASAQSFTTADGRSAFMINCRNSSTVECYAKARETCGGNYDLLRHFREGDIQTLEIACTA